MSFNEEQINRIESQSAEIDLSLAEELGFETINSQEFQSFIKEQQISKEMLDILKKKGISSSELISNPQVVLSGLFSDFKKIPNQSLCETVLSTNFYIKENNPEMSYQFIQCIGKGSTGDICIAKNRMTEVECAIKIMNIISLKQERIIENEFQIMLTCDHPNIVKIIEVFK